MNTEENRSVDITTTTFSSQMASLEVLDHERIEWERVHRTAFLIHQYFRYDYPGPINDLNHRLVIIPPEQHLDQRRVVYRLEVSADGAQVTNCHDPFGNVVLQVYVPFVEESITFEAWVVTERRSNDLSGREAHQVPFQSWLTPASRTEPNGVLRTIAGSLRADGCEGLELARRINSWVFQHMRYEHDQTDIRTTAAEALSLGRGVCQDFAHIMIALCHLCELPARYVSGHLLGEGGTHAWVEVLLPDSEGHEVCVWPFDPTHDCQPGLSYVTIAVGRDYGDVAPTSGTFRASYCGSLSSRKQVGLTAVEYLPGV